MIHRARSTGACALALGLTLSGCTLTVGLDDDAPLADPGHGLPVRDPLPARSDELAVRDGEDSLPPRPGDPPGTEPPGTEPPGTEPPGTQPPDGTCLPPPVPVRRVSHAEYRFLVEDLFPEVALPDLTLPRDLVQGHFDNERASLVASPLLVDAYHNTAQAIAAAVVATDGALPCEASAACAEELVRDLGKRAFRRPLTDDDVADFLTVFEGRLESPEAFRTGAQLLVQALLESPEFLYRVEQGTPSQSPGVLELDAWSLASRLSFLLWSSAPDDDLYAAAESGALLTEAGLAAEVERMIAHPKTRRALDEYFRQWLDLERVERVTKAEELGFSPELQTAMREETRRFLLDILLDEDRPLDELITSRETYVNDVLAPLYGVPAPPAGEWARVELDEGRSGFLTQASFLASRGHPTAPSPVLRSVLLLERVLCLELGTPPPGAEGTPLPEGFVPETNRERYEVLTGGAACIGCHEVINPVGFALEGFDTVGRARTHDNGVPVDVSGSLLGSSFNGAAELGQLLAAGDALERCAAEHWVTYAFGAHEQPTGSCLAHDVEEAFVSSGSRSFKDLLRTLALHPELRALRTPDVAP